MSDFEDDKPATSDFSEFNRVIGWDNLPKFTLQYRADEESDLIFKMRVAETAHLNRIASALEDLVRQGQQQRTEARRTRSKKGTV